MAIALQIYLVATIGIVIKLSIAGKDTIKEDDFGEWSSNSLVKDYDITSSISGSEDDDNREFGGHSDLHRGLLVSTKRKVFVRLPNGEVVSFRKCLLLGDSEKILFEHDLSGSLKDDDTPFVTVREVIEKLLNVKQYMFESDIACFWWPFCWWCL
ncbi:hypothetical protein L1987_03311 [Smallanthus sonchifolius]|uniref:Uncharacterized protein n=1 Tax=Smallanthus sonchifolius TaxID=185202 RepID=A0ACB9KAE9_9ASTR|nr:hypothetical protein L1987_03311 [Smallanthus sonchifolius]